MFDAVAAARAFALQVVRNPRSSVGDRADARRFLVDGEVADARSPRMVDLETLSDPELEVYLAAQEVSLAIISAASGSSSADRPPLAEILRKAGALHPCPRCSMWTDEELREDEEVIA